MIVDPPDLPELEPAPLPRSPELSLEGAVVDGDQPLRVTRVRVRESELRGVALTAAGPLELILRDTVLRDCELSNLDARGGAITRTELHRSRLVGFRVSEGRSQDLRVVDCSLRLCSFALAGLQRVVFERVNLAEASFMDARMQAVEFIDCRLEGADFRGAKLRDCTIRGSSLDGVLGIESLRGLTMPWPDVVASAASLAATLGIEIERD